MSALRPKIIQRTLLLHPICTAWGRLITQVGDIMGYRPSYTPRRTATGKQPLTTYLSDQIFAELDTRARQANLSRAEYAALVLSHHIGMPSKSSTALGMVTTGSTQGTVPGAEQAQTQAKPFVVQCHPDASTELRQAAQGSTEHNAVPSHASPKPDSTSPMPSGADSSTK
jgi:hypothetical protein